MHPWLDFIGSIQEIYGKIFTEATCNPIDFWPEWGKRFEEEKNKKFEHWGWKMPHFQLLQNLYMQFRKTIEMTMLDIPNITPQQKQQMDFFLKQWLDAISPNNIPWLNPEVLEKIIQTGGMNIVKGFMQLMEDMAKGSISLTNSKAFEVGKTIACTPGCVILKTDLFELIAYEPKTKMINKIPIFIVPSWINKFYIVDLKPDNSLILWLIEQGFSVYTISWVNPNETHDFDLKDYVNAIEEASNKALKHSESKKLHGIGYCFGGNALICSASKSSSIWQSITLLACLIDFNLLGELKIFINEEQLNGMKKHLSTKTHIDGKFMQWIFQFIRANDLIWNAIIKNYWLGEEPITLDFLFWNADPMNISYKTHLTALESWCWKNELYEEKFSIEGKNIKISEIEIPILMVGAKKDHITPWKGCFAGMHKFKNSEFILSESGHIAGIINSPSKNKYGYYYNSNKEKIADKWLNEASFTKGSWWPFLSNWLIAHNPETKTSNFEFNNELAPGEYVQIRY